MELQKKGYSDFHSKNNRKHFAIAVKYMKNSEHRIAFSKDIEITDEKADTIYSDESNEIE